jgi:hypothetical protein
MQLVWRRFDRIGLQRIVQLINKSNQFNLTTHRYTEEETLAVMDVPRDFCPFEGGRLVARGQAEEGCAVHAPP